MASFLALNAPSVVASLYTNLLSVHPLLCDVLKPHSETAFIKELIASVNKAAPVSDLDRRLSEAFSQASQLAGLPTIECRARTPVSHTSLAGYYNGKGKIAFSKDPSLAKFVNFLHDGAEELQHYEQDVFSVCWPLRLENRKPTVQELKQWARRLGLESQFLSRIISCPRWHGPFSEEDSERAANLAASREENAKIQLDFFNLDLLKSWYSDAKKGKDLQLNAWEHRDAFISIVFDDDASKLEALASKPADDVRAFLIATLPGRYEQLGALYSARQRDLFHEQEGRVYADLVVDSYLTSLSGSDHSQ